MEKVILSAPFAKTIQTEDGGRELWGWATLETVDKSGEIADFEGTVKAFEKWSNDTEKRTGGKSKGNVRLMHQPIAVGKTISWQPSTTTILDENGNEKTVRGIWVGAYIPPTKPDVIRDIDEGILSAFSIGGSYQKRWWDDQAKAFRFIPELSEYSLVDNPCVQGADITQVIAKADVPWNRKEGEQMGDELAKENTPEGGENTMTKAEEKLMEVEQVIKAAEAAGITIEQVQALFKALNPQDQPPAPVHVDTVDGDFDKDKNKEFPNGPEDAPSVTSAEKEVKDAEEEVGVAEKAADGDMKKEDGEVVSPNDDQPEGDEQGDEKAEKATSAELKKEGKSISKKNAAHMLHAVNHLDAVMKGADYTAADHLVVESQIGQGNTGEESPAVDVEKMFLKLFSPVIETVVTKSLQAELQKAAGKENDLAKGFTKAVDDIKSLVKGLASQEDLKKAVGELEAVKALVKEIHETPQVGGPLLNGGNPAFFAKNFSQTDISQIKEEAIREFVKCTNDPILKDKLGQELALREARKAFQ